MNVVKACRTDSLFRPKCRDTAPRCLQRVICRQFNKQTITRKHKQKTKMSDETSNQVSNIPKAVYKLRCLEAETRTVQSSGNKMYSLVCEIIPNGKPTMVQGVCIDGAKLYGRSVITVKALSHVNKCRSAFGLAPITAEDIDNTDAAEFIGNECYAICSGKTEDNMGDDNEPMKDPYTGETLVKHKKEIVEWIPRPAGKK